MSSPVRSDPFGPAKSIADAVLYEGYVLYPYRASSSKNQLRWQWGIVGPPGAREDGVGEEPTMRADLVVEHTGQAIAELRLRFLRVVHRQVERRGGHGWERIETATIADETYVSFDDAEELEVDTTVVVGTHRADATVDFGFENSEDIEMLDPDHRVVRRRGRLVGEFRTRLEPVTDEAMLVSVEVLNTTPWEGETRDDANGASLIGAHVMGAVATPPSATSPASASFLSVVDPPAEHAAVVQHCDSHRLWPVVIGGAQRAPLVLASPVILGDQPQIAPESRDTFYDGLEIDELLTLRVMTMTDEEKAEARATHPRAAAVVDRVDSMEEDELAGLHGAVRAIDDTGARDVPIPDVVIPDVVIPDDTDGDFDFPVIVGDGFEGDETESPWWDPGTDARFSPGSDGVVIRGHPISRGAVVRLHPSRRADAHDLFYRDRTATVAAILHDVDGSVHVAVTIDDDPAAEINDMTGRFLYFAPEEIEPLGKRVDR